jgi:hypothetical protein
MTASGILIFRGPAAVSHNLSEALDPAHLSIHARNIKLRRSHSALALTLRLELMIDMKSTR